MNKQENIIYQLDKLFENRVRLGIMSILVVNDWIDFKTIKSALQITDGNIATNMTTLEKHEYIQSKKEFVGKKTKTSYAVTVKGRNAFKNHLAALEKFVLQNQI